VTHTRSVRSRLISRVLATVAAVTVTAVVIGAGVNTASASISTDRGTAASVSSVGSLDASGITAGTQVERLVTIRVQGGSRTVLTVTAETSSVLDQDTHNGLQLRADACSETWRRTAAGYSCAGTVTTLIALRPIVGSSALAPFDRTVLGQPVRLTVSLPDTADARFMGQTSALSYRVAA
jgi:spore coat-associated protein N